MNEFDNDKNNLFGEDPPNGSASSQPQELPETSSGDFFSNESSLTSESGENEATPASAGEDNATMSEIPQPPQNEPPLQSQQANQGFSAQVPIYTPSADGQPPKWPGYQTPPPQNFGNPGWQQQPPAQQNGAPFGWQQNYWPGNNQGQWQQPFGAQGNWNPQGFAPKAPEINWNTEIPGQNRSGKKTTATVIAVFIGVFLIISVLIAALYNIGNQSGWFNYSESDSNDNGAGELELNDRPQEEEKNGEDGPLSVVEISKRVTPCVVGILSYTKGTTTPNGQGSGIIMSSDGYIITNAHVVSGADGIAVVLSTGEEIRAKVCGADTRTDLAVIKIEKTGLQFATFGNSEQLQVGELVVAIGNPTGLTLAGTTTVGYVSGLNRSITMDGYVMSFIQTDAAINPGNSGGALVNSHGQVIGINSAKINQSGYEGLGFAIPINSAKPIIDSLLENGYVKDRVRIGITFREISKSAAERGGTPQGLYVVSVDNSCDAFGKLQAGDIITHVEGNEVKTGSDILAILEDFKPGSMLTMTIYRTELSEGKSMSVTIKLEEDRGITNFETE